MSTSRTKPRLPLVFLGLGLILLSSVLLLATAGWQTLMAARDYVQDAAPYHQTASRLEADLMAIGHTPALEQAMVSDHDQSPEHDAGVFFRDRLSWHPGEEALEKDLELPLGLRDLVESWGDLWPSKLAQAPLQGVDFAWMASLSRYTYWHVQHHATSFKNHQVASTTTQPLYEGVPDLGLLTVWIKLRLAAIKQHPAQAGTALNEVLHLARLALASQRLTVIQAGLSWHGLLSLALPELGILPAPSVQFRPGDGEGALSPSLSGLLSGILSDKDRRRARQALPAMIAFLDPAAPTALSDQILFGDLKARPAYGACAALNERLPVLTLASELWGHRDRQLLNQLASSIDRLVAACRPSSAIHAWRHATALEDPSTDDTLRQGLREETLAESPWSRLLAPYPELRRTVAITILYLARPRDLEAYLTESNFADSAAVPL